ncbi:MAG TPA: hypothetical protein PKA00_04075 [Saprospiraceae bacterium]|nr:hypothetical protein [Saprospiraceae bacterium]HMQ82056.1 hypothetical protein [Saprospiraceae bacterium]
MAFNILLIDGDFKRLSAIGQIFRSLGNDIHLYRWAERKDETENWNTWLEKFQPNGSWLKAEPSDQPYYTLRIRHAGDSVKGLPEAALKITYGGYEGREETRHYKDEHPFSSIIRLNAYGQLENFTIEYAQQLLDYACGLTVHLPTCLLPEFFDKELEAMLQEKYSTHYIDFLKVFNISPLGDFNNILIIWNAEKPTESINKLHCNISVCPNRQALDKVSCASFDLIIVDASLKWHSPYWVEFEGVDIVTEMREKGYRGLIVLASFAEWPIFEKRIKLSPLRYKILSTTYLLFLDLNTLELSGEQKLPAKEMSQRALEDIQYYVLDYNGLLHSAFHALKGRFGNKSLEKTAETVSTMIRSFFDKDIMPLISLYYRIKVEEIKHEVLKRWLENPTLDPYFDVVQSSYQKLFALLPSTVNEATQKEVLDWAILYLEDREDKRQEVKELFEIYGISCYIADTCWKAIELLEADAKGKLCDSGIPNFIAVFIADFRLMHTGGRWQIMQGYDVLEYAMRRLENNLSYVILTDKRGAILQEAKRKSKMNVSWYSKELLSTSQSANFLVNEIIELAQETKSLSIPDNKVWKEGITNKSIALGIWYNAYRLADGYPYYEKEIETLVEKYTVLLLLIWRKRGYKHKKIENLLLNQGFNALDFDIDNHIIIQRNRIKKQKLFSFEYTAKLLKPPYTPEGSEHQEFKESMKIFVNKLLGRRVALTANYLYDRCLNEAEKLNKKIEIEQLLRFKFDQESYEPYAGFFSTFLGVADKNWDNEADWLIEENRWIKHWRNMTVRGLE